MRGDGLGIEAVRMTRRTRNTRCSCVTRWAVNTVQVHIIEHRGSKGSHHILDISNGDDSRTIHVRHHGTLKAIHHIGGIHYHDAVTRHVGELRGDRECFRTAFHRGGDDDRRCRIGVEVVTMTRWARDTCRSCYTRVTRRAIHAVQVHIVFHSCTEGSHHIANLADDDDACSEFIRGDRALKAVHVVGGIHNDHAVARHVGEFRGDRQGFRSTLDWGGKRDSAYGCGIEAVGMTGWSRYTCGTRCTCYTCGSR